MKALKNRFSIEQRIEKMTNNSQKLGSAINHSVNFLAGIVIGGLTGAAAAILLAPQSGKETREQIRQKATELRDQTTASVEDAVSQVRSKADQIKDDVSEKAKDLKQQGEDVLVEQLDRVSAAAETGKKAIQGKHN
jgi:gas vesicle protein